MGKTVRSECWLYLMSLKTSFLLAAFDRSKINIIATRNSCDWKFYFLLDNSAVFLIDQCSAQLQSLTQ